MRGVLFNRSGNEVVIPLSVGTSLNLSFLGNDSVDVFAFVAYEYAWNPMMVEFLIACSWLGDLVFTSLPNATKRVVVIRTSG